MSAEYVSSSPARSQSTPRIQAPNAHQCSHSLSKSGRGIWALPETVIGRFLIHSKLCTLGCDNVVHFISLTSKSVKVIAYGLFL